MGEVEKPFGCPEPNCGMSFTNEDHLQVHRHQHDVQLSMAGYGQPAPSLLKPSGFIVDQTPTPTRFLKQVSESEDVNLFPDISLNPFDIEFHNAAQSRRQLAVPDPHTSNDSLETPRIVPPVESDETISSTSKDDVLSTSISANSTLVPCLSNAAKVSSIHVVSRNDRTSVSERKEPRRRLTLNVTSASESAGQSSNVISTPTPVITAGPSVSQSLGNVGSTTPTSLDTPTILHQGSNNNPTVSLNSMSDLDLSSLSPTVPLSSSPSEVQPASPVSHLPMQSDVPIHAASRAPPQTPASLTSVSPLTSCSLPVPSSPATVLQLVLRFPNGQSVPVEIPANPVVSGISPSLVPSSTMVSIAPAPTITNLTTPTTAVRNSSSLAKMKLKEALASSNTAARPGSTKHSRANTANRIAEMTRSRNLSGTSIDLQDDSNSSCSSGMSNPSFSGSPSIGRRRRSSNSEGDPAEKRRKFLERNRVAAIRCREKKKRFVESLSAKSDELGAVNQRLQSEVAHLKSEVASLKTLLLKHKDCPVTIAMRGVGMANGSNNYPSVCTTFKIEKPSGMITEVTKTPISSSNGLAVMDNTSDFHDACASFKMEEPLEIITEVIKTPTSSSGSVSAPLSSSASGLDEKQGGVLSSMPVKGSLGSNQLSYISAFNPTNSSPLCVSESTSLAFSTTNVSFHNATDVPSCSQVPVSHQEAYHKPRSRSMSLPSLAVSPSSVPPSASRIPPMSSGPLAANVVPTNEELKFSCASIPTMSTQTEPSQQHPYTKEAIRTSNIQCLVASPKTPQKGGSKLACILPRTLIPSSSTPASLVANVIPKVITQESVTHLTKGPLLPSGTIIYDSSLNPFNLKSSASSVAPSVLPTLISLPSSSVSLNAGTPKTSETSRMNTLIITSSPGRISSPSCIRNSSQEPIVIIDSDSEHCKAQLPSA